MISIVFLKQKSYTYKIHKDYLLKRSIFIQQELSELGIKPSGFLIESAIGLEYTDNTVLKKNTPITLITDSTLSSQEFKKIKLFLNSTKIDVLGCVVSENQIGNKTILHPCLDKDENIPNWYKNCKIDFSQYTIPGYTCFTLDSVTKSFRRLLKDFPQETFRLKFGNGTSGVDHHKLRNETDLSNILVRLDNFAELPNVGVSIEINLKGVTSYGITKFRVVDKEITTIGRQYFKNKVYIGSELVPRRGILEKELITINTGLCDIIHPHSEQLNRFNTDIVIGKLSNGTILKCVTDLSLKIGAATIPEIKKIVLGSDTGVYQIYSTEPIRIQNQKFLTDFLKKHGLELSVLSKYIMAISYPLSKKYLLSTPEFRELENNIKNISYSKNTLFSQ